MKTSKANLAGIEEAAVDLMKNATVKLSGKGFTGSGVILTKDPKKGNLYILTAKHNLTVLDKNLSKLGDPGTWAKGDFAKNANLLREQFRKEIKVHIRTGEGAKTESRPIASVAFFEGGADFQYDVCLLHVSAAVGEGIVTYSGVDGGLKTALELKKTSKDLKWVQMGYGAVQPGAEATGVLQWRAVELKDATPSDYFDTGVGTNKGVLLLKSSAAETSLPGDSGGPLFAVAKGNQVHVLGVTLGADAFKTKNAEDTEKAKFEDDDIPDGTYNNTVTAVDSAYEALRKSQKSLLGL
jgi:hypothetical protein